MDDKKLYITTAIPYANGTPHIGNAIDYLVADIWARYQRQHGHEVRFQVGTDEHGNKIAAKAAESGLDPKSYTDKTHVNFKVLMDKIGVGYTDFIRTSDTRHVAAVQYIWDRLRPYIYKGSYEGWYSVGEEAFVSDKVAAANNGISPDHGVPYQRLSEENYYFKLSEFAPKVRELIESGELRIEPAYRRQELINLIDEGIEDLSISRPRKNLSWGVPVPDDPDQVMYVWVDALSNYITVLGYPDIPGWHDYWPADVQVIGKDILRFHALIWPAMLLALELPLPKVLLAHGHISSGGVKMSKTVGNVVDPNEVIDSYGLDAFRYYFSRHIPTLDDGDFTWAKFEAAYNGELSNDLGNLVQRVVGMVTKYQSGVVEGAVPAEHDMDAYHEAFESFQFDKAVDEIWLKVRSLNQYIDTVKPWAVAKKAQTDPESVEHLADILRQSVSILLQIGELLYPFLPNTSESIKRIFGTGVVTVEDVLFPKIYLHSADPNANKPA